MTKLVLTIVAIMLLFGAAAIDYAYRSEGLENLRLETYKPNILGKILRVQEISKLRNSGETPLSFQFAGNDYTLQPGTSFELGTQESRSRTVYVRIFGCIPAPVIVFPERSAP